MGRTLLPIFHALRSRHVVIAAICGLALIPALAFATPCVAPAVNGTVVLPPAGCDYLSPADVHVIINGLPPGDTIKVGVEHERFFNVSSGPGPIPGSEIEHFSSTLLLTMKGTGGLSSFVRTIPMNNVQCETHVDPRTPGDPVQSFDTEMFGLQGQLPPGDPDFDLLRITAGTGFGMPSPGHTTLTLRSDGQYNIDSFFDITYRIDFVGHPGSILGGMSGSTTGTIRMATGETVPPPPGPCVVVDNGTGTVDLPPQGCGYVSPADLHMMINGLPPGTTINVDAKHQEFFNVTHGPGGSLGGETEHFQSFLFLRMEGTGALTGFTKIVSMQAQCQTDIAPRTPGDPKQSFDTEMFGLQGQLPPGDPDFDLLRITAGSGFGMPSPGHTTLTRQPGTPQWNVDSFFDITYRIDFIGHPGGPLGGMSGSTTGTIRMQTGQPTLLDVPGGILPTAQSVRLSNHPNPFGLGTTLEYRLPVAAAVRISVFDAAGHLVRGLANEVQPAGPHAMLWDGRNDLGKHLSSGTYFVKLIVNGQTIATKKTTLVR